MKTYIHLWSYLGHLHEDLHTFIIIPRCILLRMRNYIEWVVEKIKPYFMSSSVLQGSCRLLDNVEKIWYSWTGHRWQYNTAHALCSPDNWRKNTYLIYVFTPWNRVFLEKLTGSHLVKKFPAIYVTRNRSILLLLHGKNGYANAPRMYFTCTWRVLIFFFCQGVFTATFFLTNKISHSVYHTSLNFR